MIKVKREPEDYTASYFDLENCCFCRERTPYWTVIPKRKPGEQVACCEKCAKEHDTKDVPSKMEWCQSEHEMAEKSFGRKL